jgi:hypothetical protein
MWNISNKSESLGVRKAGLPPLLRKFDYLGGLGSH